MGFITKEGLIQLDKYEYKSGGYSWLDYKMNHWWNFCLELLPMWIAPNTITLIGYSFIVINYVLFAYFGGKGRVIPWWVFIWSAVAQFSYQTLDAIDGKQARRTGSSSPLG